MAKIEQSVAIDDTEFARRLQAGRCLEARDLRKVYGHGPEAITVLDGINLELRPGEMVAIVGPSGTGKSTLLHLLAALDTPTSGAVYFDTKALEAQMKRLRSFATGESVSCGKGTT